MTTAESTEYGLDGLVGGLRSRLQELAAAAIGRFVDAEPTREQPTGPALQRFVERHLQHLLGDDGNQPMADGAPSDVPATALPLLYRSCVRVLLEALRESADQDSGVDPSGLMRLTTRMWRSHDAVCAGAEQVLERRARGPQQRDALVARLLEGRARRSADVRDAAAYLELRPVGRYAVAVVEVPGAAPADHRALERHLASAGFPSAWRGLSEQCIGVVDLGTSDLSTLAVALQQAASGNRAGISPAVSHLMDLPTARRHADTALLTVPAGKPGVAVLQRDLPGALLAASPDLAGLLCREFLGPVLELSEAEREPLLTTVAAYAATGGSAKDAARALNCHRNTVWNRLRRFELLSGHQLDVPEALLTLWLATRARHLRLGDP